MVETYKHQWTLDPSSANDLTFTQKCNFAVGGKTEDWKECSVVREIDVADVSEN